ncbi:MAG: hypothetical protein ACW98U_00605 [Candidatus Thorarchaeota archaeon]|jgi:UDP-2,3-diacylglucosamine pyrophosphatase LpxH
MDITTKQDSTKMIIAVSDLHLGSPQSNKVGFQEFIREFLQPNQSDISHLILLGDIVDLWRYRNSRVLSENADIIGEIGQLDMRKTYIIGNHDYAILNLLADRKTDSSMSRESAGALDHVKETLNVNHNGLSLKFIHGHQIDYWSVLQFYTIFSQAMCFVDIDDQYLYNVWNIVNQFGSELPSKTQALLKNLSRQNQIDLEQLLAGPLDGDIQGEKEGYLSEWNMLKSVMNLSDSTVPREWIPDIQGQIELLSGVMGEKHSELIPSIERFSSSPDNRQLFADLWESMVAWMDNNPKPPSPSDPISKPIHMCRRIAATFTTGLRTDEFLIRGHGHTPYVSQDTMVADTGCWLGTKGSYIQIDKDQVSVHKWGE